jgi:NitT/TauT family transport system substrate-binding protein
MKRIVSLALASAFGLVTTRAAFAQTPKLEKTRIAVSVGGSISQMNKVAYFVR